MTPPPIAVSPILCEQAIVDRDSGYASPINIFSRLRVNGFPSAPQKITAFATLTNGRVNGTVKLVASRLDTGEAVYEREYPISFTDPLAVVNVTIRLRSIEFPVEGRYEFVLFVDSDPIAQRTLHVFSA
jgi:hypothetical protein